MIKIGHRGAKGYEPENTLRSFAKAIELGADMIEFDIQLTKDKKIVVFHDERVDRLTNGQGKIENLTLFQIKELNAGKGERVPTLAEALEFLKGKCKVNIEAKGRAVADYLVDELKALEFPHQDIIISTNYFNILKKLDKQLPKVKVAWVFRASDNIYKEAVWIFLMFIFFPLVKHYVVKRMSSKSVDIISIHHLLATKNFIDRIHKCNKIAFTWTVNQLQKIRKLKEWQVDGIHSDYPDRL